MCGDAAPGYGSFSVALSYDRLRPNLLCLLWPQTGVCRVETDRRLTLPACFPMNGSSPGSVELGHCRGCVRTVERGDCALPLQVAAREAARFGIRADCAADYHADSIGTEAVYESVCEAVCQVRSSAPLKASWKQRIDADFKGRKR